MMSPVKVNNVTPQEAWAVLQQEPAAVVLDVRSTLEFDYVGHPLGALPVPWKEAPAWQQNPDFAAQVRAKLQAQGATAPENMPILAICRSGGRSLQAAEELARHGFTRLYNILEGFEGERDANKHRGTSGGWRFHGLPWEQT